MKKYYKILEISVIILLRASCSLLAQTTTFVSTGAVQTFTVPTGIFSISVQVYGAQGANAIDTFPAGHSAGMGSCASGRLAVLPGEVMYIYVGGAGANTGLPGFNGGGIPGLSTPWLLWCLGGYAGGGGGASDIRTGGNALTNRVIVAGGGGGSGRDYCEGTLHPGGCGGNGGGGDENGGAGHICGFGHAGSGTNFGSRGLLLLSVNAGPDDGGGTTAANGAPGIGGKGAGGTDAIAGGGGGGGYYGGGGGGGEATPGGSGVGAGGGGGGSSYVGGVADSAVIPGIHTGNGVIAITTICTPPFSGALSGATNICAGMPAHFMDSAGSPGGSWSSGDTLVASINAATGIVTGVSAGTAIISYSIFTSCGNAVADTAVQVFAAPVAAPISGLSNVCAGLSIRLADSSTGGVWTCSDTSIATVDSGLIMGVSVGTVIITYTIAGSGGCSNAIATRSLAVAMPPSAGIIQSFPAGCPDSIIILTDTTTGGAWSSSNTAVARVAGDTLTGVSAGTAIISYALSNICATAIATRSITIKPTPNAGMIITNYANGFCIGESITLADTIPGIWRISDNIHAAINPMHNIVTALSAGRDTIFYSVSNDCGVATDTLALMVSNHPPPISGKLSLCANDTTTLGDSVLSGIWRSSDTSVAIIKPRAGVVAGIAPGTAIITYMIDSGCRTNITLTINPLPGAGTIIGRSPVCKNARFALFDPAMGMWSSGNMAIAAIDSISGIVSAHDTGTTVITYSIAPNAYRCINTATFAITVISSPLIIAGDILPVSCYNSNNGSIAVSVTGGTGQYKYTWSRADTISAIGDLAPGLYSLRVTDTITQCAAIDSFNISQPDSLQVSAEIGKDTCRAGTGSIKIAVSGGAPPYSCLWSNNGNGNKITGLSGGSYGLVVNDTNNCREALLFTVEDTCIDIVVHDVITPNNDGLNDYWVVEGLQRYPENTVQIFDKEGYLVYERQNYKGEGNNGRQLPDGTYYYLVKLNAQNNAGGNVFTGPVLIKR
jgi:gliding motility-associated-like protein